MSRGGGSAAGNGHGRVIRALVEHGADVNASDLQNYSALHEATWCGHADVVRVLVRLGADVKMVDAWGNTPLGACCVDASPGVSSGVVGAERKSDGDGARRFGDGADAGGRRSDLQSAPGPRPR